MRCQNANGIAEMPMASPMATLVERIKWRVAKGGFEKSKPRISGGNAGELAEQN